MLPICVLSFLIILDLLMKSYLVYLYTKIESVGFHLEMIHLIVYLELL